MILEETSPARCPDNRGQTTIYFAEPSSSRQRLKTNVMLTPLAPLIPSRTSLYLMDVLIELLMRLLAIPLSPKVRGKRLVIATRLIKQLAIPLSNQKTVAKWLVISCQKSTAKSLVIKVSGITRRAGSCLQGRFRTV